MANGMDAMPRQQRDESPVIQEFNDWIEKANCLGTLGPAPEPNSPFIPLPAVQDYFSDQGRVKKLLGVMFDPQEHYVDPDTVRTSYPRVFRILLLLKKGHLIQRFCAHDGLQDGKLPFLERPRHFPAAN